jgi:dephospho-CoA kinase
MNNFYLIGLIGSIGSGKSTVRQMLEKLGARGIDADKLAHAVTRRGSPAWHKIVDTFGTEILQADGRINRRQLGKRVFADSAALEKLESIIHPAVRELTLQTLRKNRRAVVVIEAIKLVESGMVRWCDALWAVTCTPEAQIERVRHTRHMREQDTRARLKAQGAFEKKLRRAQVVIDNSGNQAATRAQVLRAWQAIDPASARDKRGWLK